jgi:predicted transposase YbfD/YdcC
VNYSIQVRTGVEFEVNSLYETVESIRDKRKARGQRYRLATVLTLSVLAKLGGEDTPEGMAAWVKYRWEELRRGLGLTRDSMPHGSTYRRILGSAIDIGELEAVLSAFFKRCVVQAEQLAMDGKSLRGTIEAGDTRGVHLLAVYAVGAGVVLKQVDVSTKENEISAAPKVLTDIDLKDKVVTGDAMFTQRDLSAQIVEAGGHYLWTVKDNQPTLRADIERLFGPEHVPLGSAPLRTDFQSVTTTTKGHGRLETHTLTTSALLNTTSDWPHLGQVFQLVRDVRHVKSNHTSHEVVYGITSLPPDVAPPKRLLTLHRNHWPIENKLHYTRDVTFHEDACQLSIGTAAQAIAILNNLVLGLLRVRGFTNIADARRRFCAVPAEALALVLNAFT